MGTSASKDNAAETITPSYKKEYEESIPSVHEDDYDRLTATTEKKYPTYGIPTSYQADDKGVLVGVDRKNPEGAFHAGGPKIYGVSGVPYMNGGVVGGGGGGFGGGST